MNKRGETEMAIITIVDDVSHLHCYFVSMEIQEQ